jgi:hypothetical protein
LNAEIQKKIKPSQVEKGIINRKIFSGNELSAKDEKSWQEAEAAKVHIDGLKKFYAQRERWSWFLMGAIGLLIVFQIVFTFFIGFGLLSFIEYKVVLGIIIGENFAQIVGLGTIVVTFLFRDNKLG